MDSTIINTVVGIIGIVTTLVGIVVGIIGWKCLSTANNIKAKNKARAGNRSTINQASSMIINNGLSNKEVSDLASETAKKIADYRMRLVTPDTILTVKYIAYSIASFVKEETSYVYTFNLFMGKKGTYPGF